MASAPRTMRHAGHCHDRRLLGRLYEALDENARHDKATCKDKQEPMVLYRTVIPPTNIPMYSSSIQALGRYPRLPLRYPQF